MTRKLITIPCGGRPELELDPSMILTLQMQRTHMTVKAMAEFHEVSESTMYRWLRKVRESNAKEES